MELIKKDFNIKQQSLQLVLLIALSLGLSACGGELEPSEGGTPPIPPTTAPLTPPTTVPVEHHGTWENKDEDGDGAPDELDDYPFDSSRNKYPVFIEQEPNDNPSVATPIEIDQGVIVRGVISSELDKGDLFKFVTTELKQYTAVFKTSSARFKPQVYISNEDGLVINDIFLYQYTKPNIYIVNFPIYDPGTYQLSLIDENFSGGPDLSYEIVFFNDTDVDSFDDMKERAVGSDLLENDMDKDKILDGLEFIFGTINKSIDIDNDSIPNWLDSDSDGDGFSDKFEGSNDLDNDTIPNFLDRDADDNGT